MVPVAGTFRSLGLRMEEIGTGTCSGKAHFTNGVS